MWSSPRLGAVNAAAVSLYFAPIWATQSLRALRSPYSGFEDQAHAMAAAYFRVLFDSGLDGLVHAVNVLAAIKFVVASVFLAYLVELARALVVGASRILTHWMPSLCSPAPQSCCGRGRRSAQAMAP